MPISQDFRDHLSQCGQEHLLAFWDRLEVSGQQQLESQIRAIDLTVIRDLHDSALQEVAEKLDWSQVRPPPVYPLEDRSTETATRAFQLGVEALRANKVGVILVAGGAGSRLGFEQPKGLYPIGPISRRSLLEVLIDRIVAMVNRYGSCVPLYLMTSPQTDLAIEGFLKEHHHFGIEEAQVRLFCQDMMPAVDQQTGQILMESFDSLALSPNGHGGMLAALAEHGCLEDILTRKVEYLFYGQIDNPLLPICDPLLIGYHILAESEMSTHVTRKKSAAEKMGVALLTENRFRIIEYSQLPGPVARETNTDGQLQFWAGSIGSHVFSTSLLRRAVSDAALLPYHAARKSVSCLDPDGRRVTPETSNAFKFERFIFDLVPVAKNPVLVEVDRREAFAPVKNASPVETDTPETAQQIMSDLYRGWLTASGIRVAADIALEINPRWALDQQEAADKLTKQTRIDEPTYFHP